MTDAKCTLLIPSKNVIHKYVKASVTSAFYSKICSREIFLDLTFTDFNMDCQKVPVSDIWSKLWNIKNHLKNPFYNIILKIEERFFINVFLTQFLKNTFLTVNAKVSESQIIKKKCALCTYFWAKIYTQLASKLYSCY